METMISNCSRFIHKNPAVNLLCRWCGKIGRVNLGYSEMDSFDDQINWKKEYCCYI